MVDHDRTMLDLLGGEAGPVTLAMLRNSVDCVKLLNTDGRISFMSENGMCAMEIEDPSTIAGKTWWALWPEDQRTALEEAFRRALQGETTTYWGQCPTGAGTLKDWDVRITPVHNADGSISSILAVSRDVTPQK